MNDVRQFTASARLQDGSVRDVTAEAYWQSTNLDVVTVSNKGEVTSVGVGLATISAIYTLEGSIDVSVASESTTRLSGLYRFEITAAPECSALPDWARSREYEVSIDQPDDERPGSSAALTLTARLGPGFAPQFDGSIEGSRLSVVFPPSTGDDGDGGGGGGCYYYYYCSKTSGASGLWPAFGEEIDTTRLFALAGQAIGIKGASHDVRISGTINGVVTAANPRTNETLAECTSVGHQFTLSRQ